MDNIRLILWFALLASLWYSYTTWVTENGPPPTEAAATLTEGGEPAAVDFGLPDLAPDDGGLPELGQVQADTDVPPLQAAGETVDPNRTVHVVTDVLDVLIDLQGGDIVRVDLPRFPVDKANPDDVIRLLDFPADSRWIFQTGLRAAEGPEPNHLAIFRSANANYRLAGEEDELQVQLDWVTDGAITASKIYTFRRGQYEIDLDLVLNAPTGWRGAAYAQMLRRHDPVERSFMSVDSYSFTGPVLYDGDKYEKLDFDDLVNEPVTQTVANGWLASIQHHFLGAIVPPAEDQTRYQAATRGGDYILTALSPLKEVAAGSALRYPVKLFVGPKQQDQLAATASELDLTVDYGFLTVLSQPLFWLLSKVHGYVGNWGWSIILVTVMIKLVFYKLTATSGRSMAKMRKIAPRMKALQERHKDDRQALSAAMMDLYKREKVNPAAGCLPMLIQMPFFFAFYWVLVESVEMRQAPFMLWISDLSVRDPFFVLPIIMGAAMVLQMRLNPAPPDPVQAKVMQIMPIAFTAMFAFFPAGLVLYWVTNTVISIAQQWRINQLVAKEA